MRTVRDQPRRGTVLILFALLSVGLMGLAALLIDMGIARLTQQQMQMAADTAALEGLRGRDATTLDPNRAFAGELVQSLFDDDLDPSNGDAWSFGAGPRLVLTDTPGLSDITNLNAGQLLTVEEPRVYKPALQANAADEVSGDLVSGSFRGDGESHFEETDYERQDFIPHSVDSSLPRDALLVRLRRTNDFQGLDNEPGVSSSGDALPLLFGRGTLIHGGDPSNGYSVRHHGVSVRSTAIAQARPALTIGPARSDAEISLDGLAPLALTRSFWLTMGTSNTTLLAGATGSLSAGSTGEVGQLIAATGHLSVGRRMTEVASPILPPLTGPQQLRSVYVPLLESIDGPNGKELWVVGFGRITLVTLAPLTIRREAGILAPINASGMLLQSESNRLPADAPLDDIFSINRLLVETEASRPLVVTAPVLVR